MKIIMLYGGKSPEHDVAKLSAFSILQAIYYHYYSVELFFIQKDGTLKQGPVLTKAPVSPEILDLEDAPEASWHDLAQEEAIVFPVLHGPNGEDGTIQGFLEIINMPYVGCGVLASACGMDKIITKNLLQQAGIPQVPFVAVHQSAWQENGQQVFDECEGSLIYPMFVKPANMGSSVGISKAEDRLSLEKALELAFQFDQRVIVEQGIEAREIEVGLLGNQDVRTTLPGEIVKTVDFYDYNAKYIDNEITMQIPAAISESLQEKAQLYAKKAYQILDGSGLARCDFFLSPAGELFLNELNTMPGFTKFSMYPSLWQERGLKYSDLIEELIQLGLNRFAKKQEKQNYLAKEKNQAEN
ncbi:D-alanine--D-alanine ligase family protein [Enterococcus timonensis]|uniref:D-alanine--D-alanine ligase family protein n=1 Tax=Enterococcus timonensis TaxID=1852364 RepID=UPI0008D98C3A|nr:D-alanine--D-alanine ligase family protein [Enterococcus timonensis]